jgi:hypothetical protein
MEVGGGEGPIPPTQIAISSSRLNAVARVVCLQPARAWDFVGLGNEYMSALEAVHVHERLSIRHKPQTTPRSCHADSSPET